jgi:hypothetical protein
MTDTRQIKRELLHGLSGRERAAQKSWMAVLEKAGLLLWTRFGVGPRDITRLRERLAGDPVLEIFEDAYQASAAEFRGRLPHGGLAKGDRHA